MGIELTQSLKLRILSAVVLAPVVLFVVYHGGWPFMGMLVLIGAVSVYEWVVVARKTKHAILNIAWGLIYIGAGLLAAYCIREVFNYILAMMFLAALWASDIGAYTAGKLIGGAKMAPTISPNKTWAGLGGAVVFAMIFIQLTVFVLDMDNYVFDLNILFLGAAIAVSGQLGDLIVSKLKRSAMVKDMGALIPGHGGLLDRIDSLLLAAPVCVTYMVAVAAWVLYIQ